MIIKLKINFNVKYTFYTSLFLNLNTWWQYQIFYYLLSILKCNMRTLIIDFKNYTIIYCFFSFPQ